MEWITVPRKTLKDAAAVDETVIVRVQITGINKKETLHQRDGHDHFMVKVIIIIIILYYHIN